MNMHSSCLSRKLVQVSRKSMIKTLSILFFNNPHSCFQKYFEWILVFWWYKFMIWNTSQINIQANIYLSFQITFHLTFKVTFMLIIIHTCKRTCIITLILRSFEETKQNIHFIYINKSQWLSCRAIIVRLGQQCQEWPPPTLWHPHLNVNWRCRAYHHIMTSSLSITLLQLLRIEKIFKRHFFIVLCNS